MKQLVNGHLTKMLAHLTVKLFLILNKCIIYLSGPHTDEEIKPSVQCRLLLEGTASNFQRSDMGEFQATNSILETKK